jgi:hypothetical protein
MEFADRLTDQLLVYADLYKPAISAGIILYIVLKKVVSSIIQSDFEVDFF